MNLDLAPVKGFSHSSGKIFDVYDDLFSVFERDRFYTFMKSSLFKIDGSDSGDDGNRLELQVFSSFSNEDLKNLGFLDNAPMRKILVKYGLNDMSLKQIRVNMSVPSERNRPHIDTDGITVLYYANLQWDLSWGGHTLFLNDSGDDVDSVIGFKPGRIAVFDGSIPHMIVTPSPLCPTYRISFALQFERKNA